jgi:twitching motility protein PilT
MHPAFDAPAYPVAGRLRSLRDVLEVFADPAHQHHGMSRFSDLHLKVGRPAYYRYDGEMMPVTGGEALTAEVVAKLVLPLLDDAQARRLQGAPPEDIDASFAWEEAGLSFRINAFHDRDGLAAVLRVLPRAIPPVESIGFPDAAVWQEICALRQGLVLLTGNTGSGKSTTIASFLQHIDQHRRARIITLEDPIEYTHPGTRSLFSQREVGRHVASFAAGLRSALREDPDIVFVGEMRDRETTSLALTAAETGHLVFSTLHTKDAKGAVTRIVDMFPPERTKEIMAQLSLSLSFVVGQKLVVRRTGGRCLAMEVLKNTVSIANLVRTGTWHQLYSTMETSQKEGMITLERHLIDLVHRGEIEHEEALRHANDPAVFRHLLRS